MDELDHDGPRRVNEVFRGSDRIPLRMSSRGDQSIHLPRLRLRRKLLCCLLLLPSARASGRGATLNNDSNKAWTRRRQVDSPYTHRSGDDAQLSTRCQDHDSSVRERQCPLLSVVTLRGGGGESDDGEQQTDESETLNPLDGNDSDDRTSLLTKANEDDDEIDAYIEQLIASVEDDPADKRSPKPPSDHRKATVDGDLVGDGGGQVDTKGRDEALVTAGARESDDGMILASAVSFDAENATASAKGSGEDYGSGLMNVADSPDSPPGEQEPPPAESDSSNSNVEASSSQTAPPLVPPARARRLPPPNPLYRALLRRRRWGGHVLAMALVTVSEFCDLWLPIVVHVWDALVWKRLVGDVALLEDDESAGGRRQQHRRRQAPSSAKELESKVRSSKRSGTSRKQLQQLQKQADQAALRILRHLKKDSKYRHTSAAFQKRHGLGPFAAASKPPRTGALGGSDGVARKPSGLTAAKAKDSSEDGNEEDDDDVDWILEALTTAKEEEEAAPDECAAAEGSRRASSSKASKVGVQPLVALEVGPTGPAVGVGVEFSLGGGIGSSSAKRRKRASPSLESVIRGAGASQRSATSRVTTSDRDSGVLGRIRAAASDSIGRSLLGAYPGDAAPISEAANPRGVLDLASRYGYGEWSEEEDEDVDERDRDHRSHTSPRRKRRRLSTSSRPSRTRRHNHSKRKSASRLGVEFDFSPGMDAGLSSSSRESTRGSAAASKNLARHSDSPPSRSPRLEQQTTRSRLSRSAAPIRPTMERANDTRRQGIPASGRGAPIRPAMERVSEAKRRRRNVLDSDD